MKRMLIEWGELFSNCLPWLVWFVIMLFLLSSMKFCYCDKSFHRFYADAPIFVEWPASGVCRAWVLQTRGVLHCNAKGGVAQNILAREKSSNILARKKETLQIVVRSREYFLKKEKSFEKLC